jgi:hypothetical protein
VAVRCREAGLDRRRLRRDVDVALEPGLLDRPEQRPDDVDHEQQATGDLGREDQRTVAQLAQQALTDVGDPLQLAEGEEAAGALDRVDRAEDAGEQVARPGVLLERDEVGVERVEVLVALHEKLLDDLVHLVHQGPPPIAGDRGENAAVPGSVGRFRRSLRYVEQAPARGGVSAG